MPSLKFQSSTTASQGSYWFQCQDRPSAISAMTAKTCASNILFMSTLTSGEYEDFISNLVSPAKEQRSPTTETALENGIMPSSAAVNDGGDLRDTTESVPMQKDGSAGITTKHVTTESRLLTQDIHDVHWHEPLIEGLLGPIIKYLESEGVRMVPKEENTIDGNMDGYVQGTTCLKDTERCSGP